MSPLVHGGGHECFCQSAAPVHDRDNLAVGGWFDDGLKIKPVCARDDMLSFTAGSGEAESILKRDAIRTTRHRPLGCRFSMISAQTRSAFVARENRCALFRIMLASV
ncbi:hypothetical protein A1D31_12200 [Bradyrhizobium liaoningense]|nr:hypothetical protein A1D31_12200 [Bradyrhizobium liaoningense]